jgi:hypothetical protein
MRASCVAQNHVTKGNSRLYVQQQQTEQSSSISRSSGMDGYKASSTANGWWLR